MRAGAIGRNIGLVHRLLDRTRASIENQAAGMTAADFERHPPGKWSSAGILEHLSITFEGTRRNLQKCLDTGARRATRPTLGQRLAVVTVVELGRFPTGAQAPAITRPKGLSGEAALEATCRNLAAMDGVMTQCEARFGKRGKIADHPILGPLTLRQWRRFHWAHTRHHMKQIARLKEGDAS
jgi:hypothetical protein